MPSRIAVVLERADVAAARCPDVARAEVLIDWRTERANVLADRSCIHALAAGGLGEAALDLLDVAAGLYIADIAVRRGEREAWPRQIELAIPVRRPALWRQLTPQLARLIYALTRDNVRLSFYEAPATDPEAAGEIELPPGFEPDCVSMLSGGLDSLAGAVMLQQAGRRPIYSIHRSGNPTAHAAQDAALAAIDRRWPSACTPCPCSIAPDPRGEESLPFPRAEEREASRRARSLLFMALAGATAEATRVRETLMCENGLLTAGLPLSASRAGSMSTHSTHPAAVRLFNEIAERAGLAARVTNPFIYQTKAELIRDVLAPHLSPSEIQSTVSCWAAGRAQRQCGGCIPCLLRRIGMAWAGLPEEAYMVDVLGSPGDYVGTDAYGNLVDLLRHARQISEQSDAELMASQPALLSLQAAGVSVPDVIAMLRRHAEQTLQVVRQRFPDAARLIS